MTKTKSSSRSRNRSRNRKEYEWNEWTPTELEPDTTKVPSGVLKNMIRFVFLVAFSFVGIAIGLYTSSYFGSSSKVFVESAPNTSRRASAPTPTPALKQLCEDRFLLCMPVLGLDSFQHASPISLVLHRNGEPTPCGEITIQEVIEELKSIYTEHGCPVPFQKYRFESYLTESINIVLEKAESSCQSLEKYGNKSMGFLGYCDAGEDHTPVLLDHGELIPVEESKSLPCHFHTREGLRVTQTQKLSEMIADLLQKEETDCEGDETSMTCAAATKKEIHLYAVPAGRVFMFAPTYIGEIFHLPHVPGASEKPIYLKVLSLEPRVFDVFNFFNRVESQELVDRAIAEKSETHRIKRSTTGASEKALNSKRTSESGFDTSGKTAIKIKKRCFDALGFDEYIESHSDGLQILRYNVSKAYNSHLDWIEDTSGQLKHDYASGGSGGNRFATILLYMSDLEEGDGGETVFPKGENLLIPESERITKQEARRDLRASESGDLLSPGSWEEELVTVCRSQLSVRPHSSRAVLFYSQHPNGEVDDSSLHGACPVLSKQKYAANLWVWNTPRTGFSGAPIKKRFRENGVRVTKPKSQIKIYGTFLNSNENPEMDRAKLFYEDTFWGKLGKGDPKISVNTYQGHVWNIKVDNKIVKTWTINENYGENQRMTI